MMDVYSALLIADMYPDAKTREWADVLSYEVKRLAMENSGLRAEIDRQHEEILHLRMYAPGRNVVQQIRMAPHVGPTNFEFYGIKETESN